MTMPKGRRRDGERGQVLALFAIMLVVLIAIGGLLFAGAHALVMRRQLQNAGDAAALAAANLLIAQNGCSATTGGSPRSAVLDAARSAVAANLPGFDLSNVTVTCPTQTANGQITHNRAVRVTLNGATPGYMQATGLLATTTSTAVNGNIHTGEWSVVMLDPANRNWASKRNGCPSFLIGGGIVATFEGSIMVNSTCTMADSSSGAMNTNGTSSTLTVANGREIVIGGEYNRRVSVIGAMPRENVRPLMADPLAGLVNPLAYIASTSASLPTTTLGNVCTGVNKDPCIMNPGIYTGGFNPTGSHGNVFAMRPGVYIIRGGGMKQGPRHFYSVPSAGVLSDELVRARYATDVLGEANWPTDCPLDPTASGRCGVLIYNAPATSTSGWNLPNADGISWGSNGKVRLRAYNPAADPSSTNANVFESYRNVVIWQAREPAATPNRAQPVIDLGGGGLVTVSGSVYAPYAQVKFGGGSGGSGGSTETATVQFITWDLQLQGNNNFYFEYRSGAFVSTTDYGLVE
jgi:Flp pilus assembly protein TadG